MACIKAHIPLSGVTSLMIGEHVTNVRLWNKAATPEQLMKLTAPNAHERLADAQQYAAQVRQRKGMIVRRHGT